MERGEQVAKSSASLAANVFRSRLSLVSARSILVVASRWMEFFEWVREMGPRSFVSSAWTVRRVRAARASFIF